MSDEILHYSLDIAPWVDSVSGANTLVGVNGPAQAPGHVNSAMRFIAASHQSMYAPYSSAFDLSNTSCTITCWVYFDTVDTFARVFYKGNTNTGVDWALVVDDNNHLLFYTANPSGTTTGAAATTFGVPPANQWIFVVVEYDKTVGLSSISVNNGPFDTGLPFSGDLRNQIANFVVGADSDGATYGNWLNGRVDDIRIWRRILTPGEISQIYNPSACTCTSLYALTGTQIGDINTDARCLQAYVHRLSKHCANEIELWYLRGLTWNLFPVQPLAGPVTGVELTQTYQQPYTLGFTLPDPQGLYAPENKQSAYNLNAGGVYDPLIDEARKICLRVGAKCYTNLAAGILATSSLSPFAGSLSVLTDGILGSIANSIGGYVIFEPSSAATFAITVDMGGVKAIKHAVVRFATYVGGSSGTDFTLPAAVTLAISTDNSTWTSYPARPVGGNGSVSVTPGDWNDSLVGQTVDEVFCDLSTSARYVRFTILPTGAQNIGIDEIAVYGGDNFSVLGCNLFTGYMGDTIDFTPAGQIKCVAVDVLKRLSDNNDTFLTAAYRLTSAGGVELADIVYSLLTSASYWKSTGVYDNPFLPSEIGWGSGSGLTGLQYPLWQGQNNSIMGYCMELFSVIGWNFFADGNGVLQAKDPPYKQRLPDRVCVAAPDGNTDVFDCNRHRTGKNLRNKVIVQTGTSKVDGSGSITSFEPNSISRYGTRNTRITDPLAGTIPLRQKVADYFLRDYAWNLQTLENTIRPTFGTAIKQIFGFRAPARPNLFARGSTATGNLRIRELWSLVSLRHNITHGQWTADAQFIPYVPQPIAAPNFTALNITGFTDQMNAVFDSISDPQAVQVRAYVSITNEFSGYAIYAATLPTSTPLLLTGLTPGVPIWVYLTTIDTDGNESLPSQILTAIPGSSSQLQTCYTINDFSISSILTSGPDPQGYYTYQFLALWTAPSCGFTQDDIRAYVGSSPPANPDDRLGSWPLHDGSWNWWGPNRIQAGRQWNDADFGQLDFTITFKTTSNLSGLRIYFRIWNSARTRAWIPVQGNYAFCTIM